MKVISFSGRSLCLPKNLRNMYSCSDLIVNYTIIIINLLLLKENL